MEYKISIVIVNYNTAKFIKKTLESIIKYLSVLSYEVIVVDNNSQEDIIKSFPQLFPDFHFYFLDQNRGFGSGCNYGVLKAKGKYILFLNPDVEIEDSSIKELVYFLDKNHDAGACSGLTVDEENKVTYCYNSFPDLSWEFKQATGFGLMNTIYKLNKKDEIQKNVNFEVDWFHGAFLLVRKSVFNAVQGFDEKIFLYYEDVDLQKKIKESGKKIYCIPSVRVLHHTQSSVRNEMVKKTYYYHLNLAKLYYFTKYFSFLKTIIIRIFYVLGTILKVLKNLLDSSKNLNKKNRFKELWIVLKVYILKYNVKTTQPE